MVECDLAKVETRVRFSSLAPFIDLNPSKWQNLGWFRYILHLKFNHCHLANHNEICLNYKCRFRKLSTFSTFFSSSVLR